MNLLDYVGAVCLALYVVGWIIALGHRFMTKDDRKRDGIAKRSSDA